VFAITAGLAGAAEQRAQEVNYFSIVGKEQESL
jgi:hypothetical protein